jgi:putative salt-induced outer membrane protein
VFEHPSATLLAACVALASFAAASGAQTPKPTTSFTGDLGYVNASGNTKLSTLNVGDKLVHTAGPWTLTQVAAYVYGQTKDTTSANQFIISGRADWAFQPRLALFAGASDERNTFAGFNSRTNELVGLEWKAVVAASDTLNLDAGGVLTQESDVGGATQSYPAARAAINYKHSFSKAAYFQQLAEYLPDLQTSGAYRVNTQTSLVAPISAHIGIKVSYAIQYNSNPPAKFGSTDRLLTTGVQVTF